MATIRFSKITKLPKILILSFLVIAFLLVSMTLTKILDTLAENPETDFTFSESTTQPGTTIITKYVGTATTVVIPNSLGGRPVSEIGSSAFASKKIVSLKLPNELRLIGSSAFATNLLTSLEIPDSVETIGASSFNGNTITTLRLGAGLKSIGNSAFAGLATGKGNSLIDLELPDGVETIGNNAFHYNKLTSLELPTNLKTIGAYAFESNLITGRLIVPEGVTSIGLNAFDNTNRITELVLPKTLLTIGASAFNKNDLTTLVIPEGVTTIGANAFALNPNLTSVSLPTTIVGTIGATAFKPLALATSISTVTLSGYDSNLALNAYLAVAANKAHPYVSLTDHTIGTTDNNSAEFTYKITAGVVQIMTYQGKTSHVVIPKTIEGLPVRDIASASFQSRGIKSVVIPEGVATIGSSAFALNPNLTDVHIPTTITGTIGATAFKPLALGTSVSQVTLHGYDSTLALRTYLALGANAPHPYVSLTSQEPRTEPNEPIDFEYVVGSGSVLINGYIGKTSEVIIPKTIDGMPVTTIANNAFKTRGLTSVEFPDTINSIGYNSFEGNKLTSVTIPKFVRAINTNAFASNRLENVIIPPGVNTIGVGAFLSNKISKIVLPTSLTFINTTAFDGNQAPASNLEISGYPTPAVVSTFAGSKGFTFKSLGSSYIPVDDEDLLDYTYVISSDSSYATISNYKGTSKDVVVPSTIKGLPIEEIGSNTFFSRGLTSVKIPTSIKVISEGAFSGNPLTAVELPEGLREIHTNAFLNNKITQLTLPGSIKDVGVSAFSNNLINSLIMEEGVGGLSSNSFFNNKITEVTLPQSMVNVGVNAFGNNQATASNLIIKGFDSNALAKNYSEKYGYTYQSIGAGTPMYSGLLKQHTGMRAKLSTSGEHTAVIDSKGDLYTWGGTTWMNNNYGEPLGLGDNLYKLSPTKVPFTGTWKYVVAAKSSTFAIDEKGDVYAWGKPNIQGALGLGALTVAYTPTKVEGISNAVAIAAYSNHTLVLTEDNKLYTWGTNGNNELGLGDKITRNTPELVSGITGNIVGMAVGYSYSMVVTDDGTMYAWGRNADGNLGMGDTTERGIPTKIPFLTGAVSLSLGESYTRGTGSSNIITSNKSVYFFGGTGSIGSTIYPGNSTVTSPRKIVGIDNAIAAYSSVMMYTGIVLTDNGQLKRYSWGQVSEKLVQYAPTKLYDNANETISVGLHTYIQTMPSGEICAWGDNQYGTFGNGSKTNSQTVYLNPTPSCIDGFNVGAKPVDPPIDPPVDPTDPPVDPTDPPDPTIPPVTIVDITKAHKIGFDLIMGDLTLTIPQIKSFGKVGLEATRKVVTTEFEDSFIVTDSRGTGQGWRLDVSSTPFTEVAPVGGFKPGTIPDELPLGSLSISPLLSIDRVGSTGGVGPTSTLAAYTIIDNGAITIARANLDQGMGKFNLNFAAKSIHLIVDPSTIQLDKVNYPSGDTPYSATLTWNLVSAP